MNAVERVKTICKKRKIPISKLESDCGFANGYIGQLRKGVFPDDRLLKIAKYLKVTVEYLLDDDSIPEPNFSDEYTEIIELYSKLSDENKAAIMQIMRSLN